jgi:hypothetical protein
MCGLTLVGKIYVLIVIDHYSKWCDVKAVIDHDVKTIAMFFLNDGICKFKVPEYILMDNGFEWFVKFDQVCKNYGIIHQHYTLMA